MLDGACAENDSSLARTELLIVIVFPFRVTKMSVSVSAGDIRGHTTRTQRMTRTVERKAFIGISRPVDGGWLRSYF